MNLRTALAGAVLAAGISSAASAAIVTTTYEGTVIEGWDYAGLIGDAGTDFTGLSFTAVFVIDTSINLVTDTSNPSKPLQKVDADLFGGTPFVNAYILLNGETLIIPSPASFGALVVGGGEVAHDTDNFDTPAAFNFRLRSPLVPANFDVEYDLLATDDFISELFLYSDATGDITDFYVALDINRAFNTVTGGIPEPTTWALMILGFGGAGAMLRRSKAALAASR